MQVQVHPATLTRHLKRMGYVYKRTRYVPAGVPEVVCGGSVLLRVGAGKKGVAAGACRVVFLDESGFGLWLPLAYSWTAVGTVARCAAQGWACGSCECDRSFGLASGRGASDRVCGGVGFVSDGGCGAVFG
jgi:hypothetical protein